MKTKMLVIGLLFMMVACTSSTSDVMSDASGRVVFTITDAAADMGTVTQINVEIQEIRVHSEASGWETVSTQSQTYDLLELKASGEQALLADISLEEGTYDQVRLDIGSVVVVDDSGSHDAKLPSNELKLQGDFEVEENGTSTATFDFIADESLHVTGTGEYILAPVVKVETRSNAQVDISSNARVQILGGVVKTNNQQGMDVDGNVGVNVKIPASANLDVGLGNKVMLGNSANASANGGLGIGLN